MSDVYCAACRDPLPVECETDDGELLVFVRPCRRCVRRIIEYYAANDARAEIQQQPPRDKAVVCQPRKQTRVRPSVQRNAQGQPLCIVTGCGVVIERKKGKAGVPLYCKLHKTKRSRQA